MRQAPRDHPIGTFDAHVSRSERQQLLTPFDTDDAHWHRPARLYLVRRWYGTLSAQTAVQRAPHHV
jgi:hypothetical protein